MMVLPPLLSVSEARDVLEHLFGATQAADPSLAAPSERIKRLHDVVRSIAPREELHRYRLDGIHGFTMGRLHRRVEALLSGFDALVEDNPRLTRKKR